jgi:hypothetical protein
VFSGGFFQFFFLLLQASGCFQFLVYVTIPYQASDKKVEKTAR